MKIDVKDLEQFVHKLLITSGVDSNEALIIAEAIVWADLIGRYNHGVWRLQIYLKQYKDSLFQSPCSPEYMQKSETMCIINGHNGFGHFLGHIAMLKAIEMAQKYGLGLVGVNHSNHFGTNAYFINIAAQHKMIGLAFSNSFPRVVPFGGTTAALGTNPIAFGVPTREGRSILVDLSTSAAAGSTIRKAADKNEKIPEGIVIDSQSNAVTDPKDIIHGSILPFGGAKGFSLGLMVEILSGVITGASISHEIHSLYKSSTKYRSSANIGHFFLAIDIVKLMPVETYYERIETLTGFIKSAKTEENVDEILIPGEVRWRNYEKQLHEGVSLESGTIKSLTALARDLNVPTLW